MAMAELDQLKSSLVELNYPGIAIMQDDEIADIFSKSNRLYFLTWFTQKWDPEIMLPLDETLKANTLVDVLYEGGLCTSQESIKFVKNPLELRPEEQIAIIQRMLCNLRILNLPDDDEVCDINYIEQMEILSKLDANIFPSMGPIQLRKPEERLRKMEKVERDIKELKREIESMNNKYITTMDIDADNDTNCYAFDLVRNQICTLVDNSVDMLKEEYNNRERTTKACFETAVSHCAKNISEVLRLYENQKGIADFEPLQAGGKDGASDGKEVADAIKRLSLLSQEAIDEH